MSRPLQVLQISHDYEGPFQQVCRQYNQAFDEAEITTVYLRGKALSAVEEKTGGSRVLFFDQQEGSLRGIKLATILRLAALFRDRRFDIVIAHRYKAIYLAGIMSYFFTIPVLLGVAHEHKVFKRLTRSLFVTLWRRRIHIVAVSESVRQDILHYCPSLGLQQRIHKLGNAIDPDTDPILSRSAARDELALDQHQFVFGTVGRLVGKKEHEQLLLAFAELKETACQLVIVGEGPRRTELEALVKHLGLEDSVSFKGHVNDASRIYSAFDAFVFCSGEKEAFGIVLLEAMLAGVPIVCSDSPGPSEVVGDAALLYESGNSHSLAVQLRKIKELDIEDRVELARKGTEHLMSEHTQTQFSKRLQQLLKGVQDG